MTVEALAQPREAVGAPYPETLKARLYGVLGSLRWWGSALPMAGGWYWVVFKVPSKPSHSVILQSLFLNCNSERYKNIMYYHAFQVMPEKGLRVPLSLRPTDTENGLKNLTDF